MKPTKRGYQGHYEGLHSNSFNSTLRDAIQRYLEGDSAEDTFLATVDVDEFSWSNVFEELSHAKSAYDEKATKNPIRRCFRHGSGMHRNLKPLAEAIPQENGLGLIKGGLQIVLNVSTGCIATRCTRPSRFSC